MWDDQRMRLPPRSVWSPFGRRKENKLKNKIKTKKILSFVVGDGAHHHHHHHFSFIVNIFFSLLDIYQARSKEEVWKEKIRDSRWPRFSSLYNWLTKEQDWFTIYIYIYTSCISISHDRGRFLFFCLYERPDDYPPLAQLGRHFFRLFHCWAD